jgi:hypothetical protein
MRHNSIPSCNSYEYSEGKCKTKSADGDYHDPYVAEEIDPDYYKHSVSLMSHRSIPSCNSYEYAEGKCKTKSADGDYHDPYVAEAIDPDYYKHSVSLLSRSSIPACTSYECKTKSFSDVWKREPKTAEEDLPAELGGKVKSLS